MKKLFILLLAIIVAGKGYAQFNIRDTNYAVSIVSVEWIPDGKAILLSAVKFHKTDRKAPFFSKVFRYHLSTRQLEQMFENGSNLAPSPDGKTIAFLKRNDNKRANIYFYNTKTKQEVYFESDTTKKNSLTWSPDGKKLMYNISYGGMNQHATIDICVLDIATKQVKQITHSGKHKSYNPVWGPDSRKIVYYFEKGDNRDQIWLTDADGSFQKNLTNDTSTHNFFPSWLDEKTILYTQSPETIMTMNMDGSNRQKVEGVNSYLVKYNAASGQLAYVTTQPDTKLVLFDWKKKTSTVILDASQLNVSQ